MVNLPRLREDQPHAPGDVAEPTNSKGRVDLYWAGSAESLLHDLGTSAAGLPGAEAAARLAAAGPNSTGGGRSNNAIRLLSQQFARPVIAILVVASVISFVVGDVADALIILVIVLASSVPGFWRERSMSDAVAALLAHVAVAAQFPVRCSSHDHRWS